MSCPYRKRRPGLADRISGRSAIGRFEGASGTLTWAGDYTGEEWWEGTDHYSVFWETAQGTIAY